MTREGEISRFPVPQSYSDERDTAEGFACLDGEAMRPYEVALLPTVSGVRDPAFDVEP
ncbi:hypothetical protein [Candidatus Poriferisodalis sp.]|uniref:hypothetical protein n=1 Tax=Candidatus Poriferisodalis sp. TaxID=3101277 RepID=UPI003B01424B